MSDLPFARSGARIAVHLGKEARGRKPIALPSAAHIREVVGNLETAVGAEPVRARETLRTLLQGGPIVMTPQSDRSYHVKSSLYPLALAMYNSAGSAGPHLL